MVQKRERNLLTTKPLFEHHHDPDHFAVITRVLAKMAVQEGIDDLLPCTSFRSTRPWEAVNGEVPATPGLLAIQGTIGQTGSHVFFLVMIVSSGRKPRGALKTSATLGDAASTLAPASSEKSTSHLSRER